MFITGPTFLFLKYWSFILSLSPPHSPYSISSHDLLVSPLQDFLLPHLLCFCCQYPSSHYLLNVNSFLVISLPLVSSLYAILLLFCYNNPTKRVLCLHSTGVVTCPLKTLLQQLLIAFYLWHLLFEPLRSQCFYFIL